MTMWSVGCTVAIAACAVCLAISPDTLGTSKVQVVMFLSAAAFLFYLLWCSSTRSKSKGQLQKKQRHRDSVPFHVTKGEEKGDVQKTRPRWGWLPNCACFGAEPAARPKLQNIAKVATKKSVPPELAWPTPEEEVTAASILDELTHEERSFLALQPIDIQHPLFHARLLRGHKTVPAAAEAYRRMLTWRKQNETLLARVRSEIPINADCFDYKRGLHFETIPFEHIGLPRGEGMCDGCVGSYLALASVSVKGWHDWPTEQCFEYIISVLEQYSVVIHNVSMKEHFMCKVSEVRDCAGWAAAPFLANPFDMTRKFKALMPVFALYPEFIHRFALFNTPASMVGIVDIFKSLMSKWFSTWFKGDDIGEAKLHNDTAKLRLLKLGDWQGVARWLELGCLECWASTMRHVGDSDVRAGSMGVQAMRFKHGQSADWSCGPVSSGARLRALFFVGGTETTPGTVEVLATGASTGMTSETGGGLLVLVADNMGAWMSSSNATLQIDRRPDNVELVSYGY